MLTLKKTVLSVSLAFGLVGVAFAQNMDQQAKESYSLGASVGNYLSSQIYKQTKLGAPVNIDQVVEGFIDALKNKSKMSEDEVLAAINERAEKLNELFLADLAKIKEKNRAESVAYMEKNKAHKGVTVTASGLQYEVKTEGNGLTPKEEDVVTVDYRGKLIDGTVFTDPEHGQLREEQFVMMTLIPALKEGIGLMKEGGSAVFTVPASLAYGEEGAGNIPPEAALIFEVTLKKVDKPGANKDQHAGNRPKMGWPHG